MQEKFCIRSNISGLVQGVCFRSATQTQAKNLKLTGWVRNLPDTSVEVWVCGSRETVLEFVEWLKVGPARAKVVEMTYEEVSFEEHTEFEIR